MRYKSGKGFTEGVKIVAYTLLIILIVLILIYLAHKFLGQTDTQGTEIISKSSDCVLKKIIGESC